MSDRVEVDSIDSLRRFRVALVKFAEACTTAMNDVESDFGHMMNWLEGEQLSHWQTQIRKRTEVLARAKEALRMRRIFKDAAGRTPLAVDEEKQVRLAQVRIEEAEQKLANVKKYTRILQKEVQTYKGSAQRFATTLQSDIPVAISTLDGLIGSLDAYVSLAAPEEASSATPLPARSEQTPSQSDLGQENGQPRPPSS